MNAGESVHSVARMRALASTITLVRRLFPLHRPTSALGGTTRRLGSGVNWNRWTSRFISGWSPRLECHSLLMQLRVSAKRDDDQLRLPGVLMRGMTYDGERWRLATVGEWVPEGPHLPQQKQVKQLQQIYVTVRAL